MTEPSNGRPRRVLLLFSDTGGGHRSAAEALIGAWAADSPGAVAAEMVDVFASYTPFPFNRFGPGYPWLVRRAGWAYAAAYHSTDTPLRARALARACLGFVRPSLRRLLAEHPADVIVSVHPLVNHCVRQVMSEMGLRRPYVTVVTDLWTAHAFWFCPEATRVIVPTEGAWARGLACGVGPEQLVVRGLPVARAFTDALGSGDRVAARRRLGLDEAGRVVLLVGGGDGMGPVYETARAIDAAAPAGTQLVVVAGRNDALRQRLATASWKGPVRVEGFVRNMPMWMAAADVLVTKAGPGTIIEGLLSGLPLVLMGKVPGQEDGNVEFVVRSGVGAWEPQPQRAAARLAEWLTPGRADHLDEMSRRARGLADPHAARHIAADILAVAPAEPPPASRRRGRVLARA